MVRAIPSTAAHRWDFKSRFRRGAFGWKSQPAIQRLKQAVTEIKKVARRDPELAAEGAVTLLERMSPALERVDSSSGSIGTSVNHAIDELVPIISSAPAAAKVREGWLERLWQAHADDEIPYIELLGDDWGELCASEGVASEWADRLIGIVKNTWSADPNMRGYFHGTSACLSAMYRARRYEELVGLLRLDTLRFWPNQSWGAKALAAMGKITEAIRFAESCRNRYTSDGAIAQVCEEILLSSGLIDEAYARYALSATRGSTFLATYRALARKYPHKNPAELLGDLLTTTPGEEGKWFATAKDAGLYDEAIQLANRTPCDPKTLTRAARDFAEKRPAFALEAGLAALMWLAAGHGYDISSTDVWAAYDNTMKAAERADRATTTRTRIRDIVRRDRSGGDFVIRILGRELGLT